MQDFPWRTAHSLKNVPGGHLPGGYNRLQESVSLYQCDGLEHTVSFHHSDCTKAQTDWQHLLERTIEPLKTRNLVDFGTNHDVLPTLGGVGGRREGGGEGGEGVGLGEVDYVRTLEI